MPNSIPRLISLPNPLKNSYFIWGPRGTGKSKWLKSTYPHSTLIDLLQTDTLLEYTQRPALLREQESHFPPQEPIIIDEIQKCPELLNEIHWLIENTDRNFILTGSSARKLKQAGTNLLGGRARRREMRPLTIKEIGIDNVDIAKAAMYGLLPRHYLSDDPKEDVRAYYFDYLKEEITNEASIRNIGAFTDFLKVAAITSSEILNYTNVARESGTSAKTVKLYFDILEDTLLGFRIQPYTKNPTRKMVLTEKFYLFDVGISNHISKSMPLAESPQFGKAFEHLILMELIAYKSYKAQDLDIMFWRTLDHKEVDFILNDMEVAIEIKASKRVHAEDYKMLKTLGVEYKGKLKQRIVVCQEAMSRTVRDDAGEVQVLTWQDFIRRLWEGGVA